MSKSIFKFDGYVAVIEFKIAETQVRWGSISKIADLIGCQRSHFSRVLSGQVHLTLEQANELAELWKLSESESDYFLALVEWARAGTKSLQTRLKRKIRRLQTDQEDLSRRLEQPQIGIERRETIYYSAWYWSAIHIIVSIPEFQTVTSISKRLALPESLVQSCLEELERFSLVRRRGASWEFASRTIHLPRSSPLIGSHHANWKMRAAMSSQNPVDDGIHYTIVQAVSRRDFQKIKDLVLELIDHYQRIAQPSAEEELICFSCDVFRG